MQNAEEERTFRGVFETEVTNSAQQFRFEKEIPITTR